MGRRFVDMRTVQQRMTGLDIKRQRETRRREEAPMADSALPAPAKELPSPDVIAKVLLGGDLAQLTSAQKSSYLFAVCDSVGLNPLTKPFEYIRLSGKEVLYATRNCTDQLRKIYGISVTIMAREVIEDCYVCTARASFPDGRHDESIGAVPIAGLKGEARSNAMMKCETKAKRRVTLSLVGLSTLDESEVESIPGAQPVAVDLGRECSPPPLNKSLTPSPGPAVTDAVIADPGLGVSATPANLNRSTTGWRESAVPEGAAIAAAAANLNAQIPETWQPFVHKTAVTGTITAGTRSKTTGKTTLTLTTDHGCLVQCYTTDHDVARAVTRYKEVKTPVTVTLLDSGEIVTLAEATDAAF
jgi:hypothetical protein